MFRDIVAAHIADDMAKREFCRERIPTYLKALEKIKEIEGEKPCLKSAFFVFEFTVDYLHKKFPQYPSKFRGGRYHIRKVAAVHRQFFKSQAGLFVFYLFYLFKRFE